MLCSAYGLSAFVKVRPYPSCNLVAYHGTYVDRVPAIWAQGLKIRPATRGIWLTDSPAYAFEHAAWRAASEGCPHAPIAVLKVRVTGEPGPDGTCPVFRPVGPKGMPTTFFKTQRIPAEGILGQVPYDGPAVSRGIRRAERGKRARKRRDRCPPPIELGRTRRRSRR